MGYFLTKRHIQFY